MLSASFYTAYGQKPSHDEFPTTIVDFGVNNNRVGDEYNTELNDWDEFLQWDNTTDGVDPSSLMQKPGMMGNFGFAPNQQWQPSSVNQSSNFMFNDMDMQDSPFEEDTPVLSPISPTEDSLRSSSGSPIEKPMQDFAMSGPYGSLPATTTSSRHASSTSTSSSKQAPVKAARGRGKRRKNSNMDEADLHQSRKRGHNAIEKRYRTNLNDKIIALRDSIPTIRASSGDESPDEDGEGGQGAQKFGKAAILTRAVEYINHLEECTKRLGSETNDLKTRVSAFEKLAMSGPGVSNVTPDSFVEPLDTLESIQAEFLEHTKNATRAEKIAAEAAAPPMNPTNKRRNSAKKMP